MINRQRLEAVSERAGTPRLRVPEALFHAAAARKYGLWLVPRVGVRVAELLETPIMITVMVFAARWILRRFELRVLPAARLATGVFALIFLLAAEFGVAVLLRGMSASEVVTKRDPVSGTVYFISLAVFALMPTFVSHFTSEGGS